MLRNKPLHFPISRFILLLLCWFTTQLSIAQIPPDCQAPGGTLNCGATAFVPMPGFEEHVFTFDTFGKYYSAMNGGLTMNGATTIRLNVAGNAACRWKLHAYFENFGARPSADWTVNTTYSATGTVPTIDILQLRIRNECSTSLTGAGFTPAMVDNSGTIFIIDNTIAPNANAGDPCPAQNVNSSGDYLTNYTQYHFMVDYKVTLPAMGLRPGNYSLMVRFCLSEDI